MKILLCSNLILDFSIYLSFKKANTNPIKGCYRLNKLFLTFVLMFKIYNVVKPT